MFRTLRIKLLCFFLLTTCIPLLFIGYISYQSQKQELTKSIEQSLLTSSSEIANNIENMLVERISDVQHLATNPVLQNPNSTSAEIQDQFQHFLNVYTIYSDTIFVNSDGITEVSFIDKVVGTNLSDRAWFKASLLGDIYLSDIYMSPVIDEPVLVMSAPVFSNEGEVIGVISPLFDLNNLWKTFNQFSEQEHMIGLSGYAFLINKNGVVIAHPDYEKILNENHLEQNNLHAQEVLQQSSKQKVHYNKERDVVLSYSQINKINGFNEDWFVVISVSKSALFSPLKQLLTNYLIIIGIVLMITTIAIFKLSTYIVSPVESLVAATSNFAIGKPMTPLLNDTYEEINRLNDTFLSMTKKLIDRERGHKKSTLILETTENGVIAINKKTLKITTFNRTCENLFQLCKTDVVNFTINEISTKSSLLEPFISAVFDKVNGAKTKKFEHQFQVRDKKHYFFISVSSLPSIDNAGNDEEMLVVINDLTEKKQMEEELFRTEKLKVAGEMAATVAHEIRNPLAIIKGFIQLFQKEDRSKENYYDIIVKEIERVNQFMTDLLNVAKPPSTGECKEINVVSLLDDILLLQKSQLAQRGIKLEKQFQILPNLFIEPGKLQQVVINIIQNAIEAMAEGGTLTVHTKHKLDDHKISIMIKDTGCGMDDETIKKLGTPFYTTKETGTGLGLATSYQIIDKMNGSISVTSEYNCGTQFTILLPITS